MTLPEPTGRAGKRLRQTVMDMVFSLIVVFAVVVGLWLLVYRPTTETVRQVDVAGMHALAAQQAGYSVLVPGSDTGLEATSVRWEPTQASGDVPVWHIGYVQGGDAYLQISQGELTASNFIAEQTANGVPGDVVQIGDAEWTRYETDKRRSLVRQVDGVVTIVSGTGSWDQLTAVAQGLVADMQQD